MAEKAETNFDEFKRRDCMFVADWLKTKGLHKLCSGGGHGDLRCCGVDVFLLR